MILFYQPEIREGIRFLDADESRHCAKVLRRKAGDPLLITDGRGTFYDGVITTSDSRRCEFEIIGERPAPDRQHRIHIAIAPTRNIERTEWFVEKAVEIGIDTISFILCAHSERKAVKPQRLHKIAISAMKQSLRGTLPDVRAIVPFSDLIGSAREEERFIAIANPDDAPNHLMKMASRGSSCCVLIGPEGDFSAGETRLALDAGFKPASLGEYRLRTETAALAATQILHLVNL